MTFTDVNTAQEIHALWEHIQNEVKLDVAKEPALSSFLHATILSRPTLCNALSFHLSGFLESPHMPAMVLREIIDSAIKDNPAIVQQVARDIIAIKNRDPVCNAFATPFLYFKGFHAIQSHRIAHWLWHEKRKSLALWFQNKISTTFGVDIHPAAKLGSGILMDHATGIVVGETAVIEDDVSILHGVTLGGTGKQSGDRHPKIRKGVLLSAGATILGNVEVGEGAKIGAGSVVLKSIPAQTTAAGIPAQVIGSLTDGHTAAMEMDHQFDSGE